MLAGRYRIVGLVGKGGMGEVYRAEDLLLAQEVALKFLPEDLSADADRLQRLLGEVRLARQVSHPNVCRVYDVGEVDGHRFFSMELIEGEDLASLLKQVGRIAEQKGVEIARQLCAGLAAAHDRGVIHRDLKPGNVMIDRAGRVRITDFGLALAGATAGAAAAAGTPGYMAPEQLAGREATERSDLWSLGVVLYEMFTGKRPYRGSSLAELRREVEESHVSSPSTHVAGLDPAIERVILRCLEKDPRHRPASASAVAVALPGGDPLAAALAAGETPSPEMVAAAGGEGSLAPARALALAALGLVAVVAAGLVATRFHDVAYFPLTKTTQVLEETSRALLRKLGHEASVVDTATAWVDDDDVVNYFREGGQAPGRWAALKTGRTPGLYFMYRQSPRYLQANYGFTVVGPENPPLQLTGETEVHLDALGRLLSLDIVPAEREGETETTAPPPVADWEPLFAAAELDLRAWARVEPRWRPAYDVDERVAWTGEYPELPGVPIRLEAAAVAGRPVHFRALGPWSRPARMQETELTRQARTGRIFFFGLPAVAFVGGVLLAWRNLRVGRGDRRGALRLASWFFVAHSLVWLLWAHHDANLSVEWPMIQRDLGYNLFLAAMLWLIYIALEPYVRRHWPETLIGWSRLVAGRLRDPRLGRDMLVGVAAGGLLRLGPDHQWWLARWLGRADPGPRGVFSSASFVGLVLDTGVHQLLFAMSILFVLVLLLLVLRKRWLALAGAGLLFGALILATADAPWVSLPFIVVFLALALYVLTRHGLTAFFVANFVATLLEESPLTTDLDAWYAWDTGLVGVVIGLLLFYGYRVATAGRRATAGGLLEV